MILPFFCSLFLLRTAIAASVCNGDASLCSLKYSNVSYIGAHNSFGFDSVATTANQDYNVTRQLSDGIRLLQGQGHEITPGVLNLCHGSCFAFNGGSLKNYLGNVTVWLDQNPNEVITLLFTNPENLDPSEWASSFSAANITKYMYIPPSGSNGVLAKSDWPTLGEMIDANTRVVAFLDVGADPIAVPYLLDEFTNIWENKFDTTDPNFDCAVNRTTGSSANKMIFINHYLDESTSVLAGGAGIFTPDKDALNVTNSVESILANANVCASIWTTYPTFILVDFYDHGNGSVFEAAAVLNNVAYNNPGTIFPPLNRTGIAVTSNNTTYSSPSGAERLSAASPVFAVGLGALLMAL